MAAAEILGLALLGLLAGALGGLVGVGGSVIIIPFLTLVLGRDQQLSQAAAMIVNVFVAAPALLRHHQAAAVRWDVFVRMLPAGLVAILAGVEASNRMDGTILMRIFGAFLLYVIAYNVVRLRDSPDDAVVAATRAAWRSSSVVGGSMGLVAGLLGVGGGIVSTPLLQRIGRLPLRQAIATSSAVMCLTAAVGAVRKNAALAGLVDPSGAPLGVGPADSLLLAACLAPTATLGALLGAGLTHTLPLRWVRLAFILLMGWASARMLGIA